MGVTQKAKLMGAAQVLAVSCRFAGLFAAIMGKSM
jgi:hypothetical protein